MHVLSFLTKITLFLLPLIFWPSPLKFELPKIIFFYISSFFLIIWLLKKGKFERTKNKTWFWWVFVLLLSTIFNNRFLPGLVGDGYRHQGIIFFLILGLWPIVLRQAGKNEKKKIWPWVSAAILVESLIILGQWLALKIGFSILSYNGRPIGTFGEPNGPAGFLVMGLPILVKTFPFYFSILTIWAILATGSKAALGALVAEGLIFGYLKAKNFPGKKFLMILGMIFIFFLGIVGVWQEKGESLFENRWLIWNLGFKATLEKPIFGYGAEGIIASYEKQYQNINITLVDFVVDRSHNLFLDVILFSGLAGAVIFLKWLWETAGKTKESWKVISFAGFLIFSFFQPIGVAHWLFLLWLLS